MSSEIVIVFVFFAGPIRGYSPGGRVNKFYSHGRQGNSHFENESFPIVRVPYHFVTVAIPNLCDV